MAALFPPRSITNAKVMTALVICWFLGTAVQTAQAVALACGLMGPLWES